MAPPHSCNFARPHTRVFVFVNERKPVDILRNPRIPNDFKLFSNSWKSKDFQGFQGANVEAEVLGNPWNTLDIP
jgi:hypothetical protein